MRKIAAFIMSIILVIAGCELFHADKVFVEKEPEVFPIKSKSSNYEDWPILKCYDQNHLGRIALPLGGIGTETVSLGGRGDLRA